MEVLLGKEVLPIGTDWIFKSFSKDPILACSSFIFGLFKNENNFAANEMLNN